MAEREVKQRISSDDFDLDIQIRFVTRQVEKFSDADTASCASTCGDECTNSCASTCDGGCTDTCSTCGSCTSECDGSETAGGCREFLLFEDRVELVVNQVRADGVSRKVERADVMRRVERAEGR